MSFLRHAPAQRLAWLWPLFCLGCASSVPHLAVGPYAEGYLAVRGHLLEGIAASGHVVGREDPVAQQLEIAGDDDGVSFTLTLDPSGVVHLLPIGPRVRERGGSLRLPGSVRDEYLVLAGAVRDASFRTEIAPDAERAADAYELLNPTVRHLGPDAGLLLAGGVTLGAGYLMGVLAGAIDQARALCVGPLGASVGCDAYPYAFIPLAGAIPATTEAPSGMRRPSDTLDPSFFLGVLSIYAQVTGLVILIIGAAQDTTDVVSGRVVSSSFGTATVSVLLGAPGSELGGGLALVF